MRQERLWWWPEKAWPGALLAIGAATLVLAAVSANAREESQPETEPPATRRVEGSRSHADADVARSSGRHVQSRHSVVLKSDNWTFRPTVLVRRGPSQGSGTIIASLDGETLVLTASHVVRGRGPIVVELHRYNLGLEQVETVPGLWPRQVAGELAASDTSADVAVIRVRNMTALPFVARLTPEEEEATPANSVVASVGIDLGAKLTSWKTRLVEVLWFELNDSGAERPFLITARIPEHGRSGGGLFRSTGELIGVCVGHAELVKGRRMGVFTSAESIRKLLQANDLTAVIDRSEARRARLARYASRPSQRHRVAPPTSAITPTEAQTVP